MNKLSDLSRLSTEINTLERYAFLFHTIKSVNDRIDLISDELILLWKKCRIKTITKNAIKHRLLQLITRKNQNIKHGKHE
ncbi:hypothetical protein A3Q56_08306 [Intoshia linei]|uniref:Uncharacterized protein n=1 Tax=Intoshia linei TaxID=1819745 RepID=A0A177AR51_9BILA|nr:hypothetical protein A3Q56_08306 [Intoshia linei]